MSEQENQRVKAILPSVDYNYFITPKQLKAFLFILSALLVPCIIFVFSIFALTYIHRNDTFNQTLLEPGILPNNPLYPIKIFIEDNFVLLFSDNTDKLSFNMHLSNERIAEVHTLLIQAENSGVDPNNKISSIPIAYAQTNYMNSSSSANTIQLQQKADEYITFTQLQQLAIQNNLLEAQKNNNITTVYCLADKLSQIQIVYANIQTTVSDINNEINTNNINLVNHDYLLLNIELDSSQRVAQMANQCLGNYSDTALNIDTTQSSDASSSAYQVVPLALNNSSNPTNSDVIYSFPTLAYSIPISQSLLANIPTALSDYFLLQKQVQSEINKINDTKLLAENIMKANTQQMLLSDDVTGEISSIFNNKSPIPQQALEILQPMEASLLTSHDTSTQGISNLTQYNIPIASTFTVNDLDNLANIVHNTLLVPQTSQNVQQTDDLMQLYMKDVTNNSSLIGNLPNSNTINTTLKKEFLSSLILVPDQLKINQTSTPAIAAVISNILPLNASSLQSIVTSVTGVSVPEAVNFYISQMNIDKNTINQFVAEKQSPVYIIPLILSFNQTADDTKNLLNATKTYIPNNQNYITSTANLTSSVNQAATAIESASYAGNTNNTGNASNSTASQSRPTSANNSSNIENNQTLTPIPTVILTPNSPSSSSSSSMPTPTPSPTIIPIPTQATTIQIIQSDYPPPVSYPTSTDCSNTNPNGSCTNGQTCQNLGTSFGCSYSTCSDGTSCHNPYSHGAYDCGAQCASDGSRCCLVPTPTNPANGQLCSQSYGGKCFSWARNSCPKGYQAANSSDPYIDCPTEVNATHPDYCCVKSAKVNSTNSNSLNISVSGN